MPNLPKPRLRRSDRSREPSTAPAEVRPTEPDVEIIDGPGLRWVNIETPTPLEWSWLQEHFDFHALDLEDVLSRNQRPKIDEYPDYLFIVLHFPVYDSKVGRLNVGELDMFVGPDFVVTIPNQPLPPVEYLFERCRQEEELRDKLFSRGSGYLLYRIVDDGFDYCFPMLRKIGNKLDVIEDDIFVEGRSDEVVRDISEAKQEIINFRKVIRPQRPVLRDLENVKGASSPPSSTSRSTSTTSSTRTSGSGTCSRTTRRWSRRSRRPTSRCSTTASTRSSACSPRSASSSCL